MIGKLNILMVTEAFYPDGIGGVHTYVYNLAKSLTQKGHAVYVITIKTGQELSAEEIFEGINVFRYKTALSGQLLFIRRPILSIINSHRLFFSLTKKIKFDLINFHLSLPAFGINICLAGWRIPKVYTFHSSMFEEVAVQIRKKKYFHVLLNKPVLMVIKWIEKINLKFCRKIIVLSDFSRKCLLSSYRQPLDKIIIIPGGVDTSKFVPVDNKIALREKLDLPINKVMLLTARRLAARMGLENLIYAMKYVIERKKNIFLLILGGGFLKEKLNEIIKRENLKEYISLPGPVDMETMLAYYQASDIFVVPTEHDEWFGLVTIEALACGLPVLGTPIGGTAEILGSLDENLLFSGTSALDMSAGILRFLENKAGFAADIQKFRTFVLSNYSWEIVCSKTEKIYFDLLRE